MKLDWSHGELAAGLLCYQKEEFFLAHEHWEGVWLRCAGPEKSFLQAIIQIAAAFHHLQRGNRLGTESLLRAALLRLDLLPSDFDGLSLNPLRQSVRAWLQALGRQDQSPTLPYPEII